MKGQDAFYLALTAALGYVGYSVYKAGKDASDGAGDFLSFLNPWSDQRAANANAARWVASTFAVRRDPKGRLFLIESTTVDRGAGEAALVSPIVARIVSQFINGAFVRLPAPQPLPNTGWQSWPIVNVSTR